MLKTSILKTTKFYKEEILNFFKGIINMIQIQKLIFKRIEIDLLLKIINLDQKKK